MTTPDPELDPATAVTVGRITAPHGIRGEVKVEPLTDFPQRFEAGSRLWLDGVPYTVERGRWQQRNVILKLRGIDTRNQAEALPGKELLAPQAMPIEDEGVYYLHDILGARVQETSGAALGELADVFSTGANDVYVVRGPRGEILLPALDDVVLEVDLQARRITVAIPDGLEFTTAAPPKRRRP
ncbi:MAG TPA: ribosome maturation factor RimM, partial [Dehalococcoidia bacterium]|nr:ribosome maturation factor RimM [Dehalococcoidia bacterium]